MLNTYGKTDKCVSLSRPRSRSPRSFSSTSSLFYLWEQSGKRKRERDRERAQERYSFLNHHRHHHRRLNRMICLLLQGKLMILSLNDICLRPIRTPHPDNISTGIMSGRISSAAFRWAADCSLVSETSVFISTSMTPWLITSKMNPGCRWRLSHPGYFYCLLTHRNHVSPPNWWSVCMWFLCLLHRHTRTIPGILCCL